MKKGIYSVHGILMFIICVGLLSIVTINITLLVQSMFVKDEIPSIFGYTPLVMQDDSMGEAVKNGSLLFLKKSVDNAKLQKGDIIAFTYESKTLVVISRIVNKSEADGTTLYTVRCDSQQGVKNEYVVLDKEVVGHYHGAIEKIGSLMLFTQSRGGIFLLIGIVIVLFVFHEIFFRCESKGENIKMKKLRRY